MLKMIICNYTHTHTHTLNLSQKTYILSELLQICYSMLQLIIYSYNTNTNAHMYVFMYVWSSSALKQPGSLLKDSFVCVPLYCQIWSHVLLICARRAHTTKMIACMHVLCILIGCTKGVINR